jgi:predicted Zn finger-like uncharacterized protein
VATIDLDVFQMTDTEKALLTHCPNCNTDYQYGASEVDADGICRVTCGYCEEFIEYKVDWVKLN